MYTCNQGYTCLPSLIHHVTYRCSQATLQQSYGVKIRTVSQQSKSPPSPSKVAIKKHVFWKHRNRNQRLVELESSIQGVCHMLWHKCLWVFTRFWPRYSPNELTRLNEPLSSRSDIWVPLPPCLGQFLLGKKALGVLSPMKPSA